MLSHGIFSVLLLILSNIFMTFAWYGHLKMREYSWFESLPLIGVIAFSWAIAHACCVHRILCHSLQDGTEMEPPCSILLSHSGSLFHIQEIRKCPDIS